MEIYQNEAEFQKMRRKNKFPKFEAKKGFASVLVYLLGILIWVGILIVSLVALYAHWFGRSLVYLMSLFEPKPYRIPFWFALLMVLLPVTFPITVFTVLAATLVKIVRV